MKIKTIRTNNFEEFDNLINSFESEHQVKATQTHILCIGTQIVHYAVIFYLEDVKSLKSKENEFNGISKEVMEKLAKKKDLSFKEEITAKVDGELLKEMLKGE